MPNEQKQKPVVVVGDNQLSYLCALYIATTCPTKVILIDTAKTDDDSIFISQSAVKHIHQLAQISELEFIKSTRSDIHLGLVYSGLEAQNRIFTNSEYGFSLRGLRFEHLFKLYKQKNPQARFEDFSLSALLIERNRFTPPSNKANSIFSNIDYGYSISCKQYKQFLHKKLQTLGVEILQSSALSPSTDLSSSAPAIELTDGRSIPNSFMIDLNMRLGDEKNGKHAIERELKMSKSPDSTFFSKVEFADQSIILERTQDSVTQRQRLSLKGGASFTDHMKQSEIWQNTRISLGDALKHRGELLLNNADILLPILLKLNELWPRSVTPQLESKAFNKNIKNLLKHVATLDSLHWSKAYKSSRLQTDSLQKKIHVYQALGKIDYEEGELLAEQQWAILLNYFGIQSKFFDNSTRSGDPIEFCKQLDAMKSSLDKAAMAAPLYNQFIASIHG